MKNYNINVYNTLEQCKSELLNNMPIAYYHRYEIGISEDELPGIIAQCVAFVSSTNEYSLKQTQFQTMIFSNSLVIELLHCITADISRGLIECYGTLDDIERFKKFLEVMNFKRPPKTVRWAYLKKDDITYKFVETNFISDLKQSHYPYIPNIEQYMEDFKNDSSNILVLLGEPGTGKTHFINELCHKFKTSPIVTFDPEVMGKESLYVDFMTESESELIILEDADLLLTSRLGTANLIMSKILNSADGLIKSKKKFIFTANINSISDIDEALIRPGRCFDVLRFRALNRTEAEVVAEEQNLVLPNSGDLTLAEIYAQKSNSAITGTFSRMGFN